MLQSISFKLFLSLFDRMFLFSVCEQGHIIKHEDEDDADDDADDADVSGGAPLPSRSPAACAYFRPENVTSMHFGNGNFSTIVLFAFTATFLLNSASAAPSYGHGDVGYVAKQEALPVLIKQVQPQIETEVQKRFEEIQFADLHEETRGANPCADYFDSHAYKTEKTTQSNGKWVKTRSIKIDQISGIILGPTQKKHSIGSIRVYANSSVVAQGHILLRCTLWGRTITKKVCDSDVTYNGRIDLVADVDVQNTNGVFRISVNPTAKVHMKASTTCQKIDFLHGLISYEIGNAVADGITPVANAYVKEAIETWSLRLNMDQAYAVHKGLVVFYRTANITFIPKRRIVASALLLINVTKPGTNRTKTFSSHFAHAQLAPELHRERSNGTLVTLIMSNAAVQSLTAAARYSHSSVFTHESNVGGAAIITSIELGRTAIPSKQPSINFITMVQNKVGVKLQCATVGNATNRMDILRAQLNNVKEKLVPFFVNQSLRLSLSNLSVEQAVVRAKLDKIILSKKQIKNSLSTTLSETRQSIDRQLRSSAIVPISKRLLPNGTRPVLTVGKRFIQVELSNNKNVPVDKPPRTIFSPKKPVKPNDEPSRIQFGLIGIGIATFAMLICIAWLLCYVDRQNTHKREHKNYVLLLVFDGVTFLYLIAVLAMNPERSWALPLLLPYFGLLLVQLFEMKFRIDTVHDHVTKVVPWLLNILIIGAGLCGSQAQSTPANSVASFGDSNREVQNYLEKVGNLINAASYMFIVLFMLPVVLTIPKILDGSQKVNNGQEKSKNAVLNEMVITLMMSVPVILSFALLKYLDQQSGKFIIPFAVMSGMYFVFLFIYRKCTGACVRISAYVLIVATVACFSWSCLESQASVVEVTGATIVAFVCLFMQQLGPSENLTSVRPNTVPTDERRSRGKLSPTVCEMNLWQNIQVCFRNIHAWAMEKDGDDPQNRRFFGRRITSCSGVVLYLPLIGKTIRIINDPEAYVRKNFDKFIKAHFGNQNVQALLSPVIKDVAQAMQLQAIVSFGILFCLFVACCVDGPRPEQLARSRVCVLIALFGEIFNMAYPLAINLNDIVIPDIESLKQCGGDLYDETSALFLHSLKTGFELYTVNLLMATIVILPWTYSRVSLFFAFLEKTWASGVTSSMVRGALQAFVLCTSFPTIVLYIMNDATNMLWLSPLFIIVNWVVLPRVISFGRSAYRRSVKYALYLIWGSTCVVPFLTYMGILATGQSLSDFFLSILNHLEWVTVAATLGDFMRADLYISDAILFMHVPEAIEGPQNPKQYARSTDPEGEGDFVSPLLQDVPTNYLSVP